MKKFRVYDIQEYKEILGEVDTMKEVTGLARERYTDTDGDCYVVYAELNLESKKYMFSSWRLVQL